MAASALLGAALSAVLLIYLPFYWADVCAMAFLVVPLMLFLSFGYNGWRQFVLKIGTSWLCIVILNGVATAVYNLTGVHSLYVYVCILVFLAARLMVAMLLTSVCKQQCQMEVILKNCGRTVCCMGLYDSGNRLQIPQSKEPVHIIAPPLLKSLLADGAQKKGYTIDYHALGTAKGQIRVFQLEQMQIKSTGKCKIYDHPWVGQADDALLQGKSYQVILNAKAVEGNDNKGKSGTNHEFIG